jgi:hypothetical protein
MSNLYDTGAPKRIIVEQNIRHEVSLAKQPPMCLAYPTWECELIRAGKGGPCAACPHRRTEPRTESSITITPEFERVKKRKLLK